MKLLLVLSLAALVCYQAAAYKISSNRALGDECGEVNKNVTNGFIIGGDEAEPHKYPWMGALHNDGRWLCGAALISEEWAITAAHCVDFSGSFEVWFGSHDITADSETNRKVVKVAKAIKHEDYNFPHDDIAVMQLAEKVEFTEFVRPICLPNKKEQKEEFLNTKVLAIGWGQADNANGQEGLRQVELRTLNEEEAQQEYCNKNYPSVLCIETSGGSVGVCFGDSGSPLNFVRDNGQYVTLGAASFVIGGCENSAPNGYSRVTANLDWISEKTGIEIVD